MSTPRPQRILDSLPFQLPPELSLKILALHPQAPLVCKDARLFFLWARRKNYCGAVTNPWLFIGKYWLWFSIYIHEKDKDAPTVTNSNYSSSALRVPIPLILIDANRLMIIEQILQLEISTSAGLRSRYNIQEAIQIYQEKAGDDISKVKDTQSVSSSSNLSFLQYLQILLPKLYEQPYEEVEEENGSVKLVDDLSFVSMVAKGVIDLDPKDVFKGLKICEFPYRLLESTVVPEAFLSGECPQIVLEVLLDFLKPEHVGHMIKSTLCFLPVSSMRLITEDMQYQTKYPLSFRDFMDSMPYLYSEFRAKSRGYGLGDTRTNIDSAAWMVLSVYLATHYVNESNHIVMMPINGKAGSPGYLLTADAIHAEAEKAMVWTSKPRREILKLCMTSLHQLGAPGSSPTWYMDQLHKAGGKYAESCIVDGAGKKAIVWKNE